MNGITLQILDTGMEEKGGPIVYSRANTLWMDLFASSLRPELNFIATNYESKLYSGDTLAFAPNRIESAMPTRFTVTCKYPANQLLELQKLIKMGRTLGLKKIQGGLGTLEALTDVYSDDIYVIINAIQISETLNNAVDYINITITMQQV